MNERGQWNSDKDDARREKITPPVPVAVVGMGCRLPGGVNNYADMWQFLLDRKTAIREIPSDRWSILGYHDTDPNALGRGRSRWAGFLDNVFDFDPGFFDLSPREALAMDPQQRLLLQVAYEAAQDAGTSLEALSQARTGVFVGISSMEFSATQRVQTGSGDIFGGTGSALSIAANRVSHRLNLNGPSFIVDTACSSALVALDQACRNLADGVCDVALAGGVNCLLDPSTFVAFGKANMLSPTGGCYAFDRRADGFIRGEGTGLVLLKRLDQAVRDGDEIHAVIRATGVNQDGRTPTLTSPNGIAQETLMREVLALAGVQPDDIGYVEAHGTGTPTGDPIEANAIGRVFGRNRTSGPIAMSSMKPNIGHLESAAGIAGILKAVMTLKQRTIAPHQNFEEPSPAIPLDALNIAIPTEAIDFPDDHGPRRAVVNSFGFGGTSACAVLEEAPTPTAPSARPIEIRTQSVVPGPQLVPVSAPNAEGLSAWANTLASAAQASDAEPATIARALSRRDHFASRAVILSEGSRDNLIDGLGKLGGGDQGDGDEIITGVARDDRRLAFTFSGQGAQWWAMGRQLLEDDEHYRAAINAFDKHFEPLAGWRVADALAASESESKINESHVTQAALIAMQVALAAAWKARGVVPDVVIGHSLGEIAAAHVAGAIDLATTARIIYRRGQIPEHSPDAGAMAAVGLAAEAIEPYLTEGDDVVIGAMNGPAMITLTGLAEPLDRVIAAIREAEPNAFVRKLNTGFAWHSRLLDHAESWFRSALGDVEWKTPSIPIISTVEPGVQVRFDLDYWWQNLRQPVRYREAILLALDLDVNSFLEIGPHRTVTPLTVSVASEVADSGAFAVPSLIRGGNDHRAMARAAAQLFVNGVRLDWDRYAPATSGPRFKAPLYPWQNQTLRQYSTEASFYLFEPYVHPLLGRREFGPTPRWINEIDGKAFPYFRDHRILGGAVLPAAGYVEMMVAALRAEHGPGTVELRSLQFPEALPMDGDVSVMLRTEYDPSLSKLRVFSRERGVDEEWRLRAEGYGLSRPIALPNDEAPRLPPGSPEPTIDGPAFYDLAERHGYEYGRYFRGVESIWLTDDDVSIAMIDEPEGLDAADLGYTLHPSSFDSALQSAIALYDRNEGIWDPNATDDAPPVDPDAFVMRIPVEIDKILVYDALPSRSIAEFVADEDGESGIYRLYGEDGTPSVVVEHLRTKPLKSARGAHDGEMPASFYVEQFRPASQPPREETNVPRGRWLIVGDGPEQNISIDVALSALGLEVTTLSSDDIASGALADAIGATEARVEGIVFAPRISDPENDPATSTNNTLTTLVAIAETIATKETAAVPQLVLLTSGARHIAGDEPASAAAISSRALQASLRTIANERPGMRWRSIDIGSDIGRSIDALAEAIVANDEETERVLRGTTWYVPRLEPAPREQLQVKRIEIDAKSDDQNYAVTLSQPGSLDNIVIREADMPAPDAGEIVVEIAAVGLNFRDIMAATSILPGEVEGEDAWWRNLGFEFSGVVRSVGSGETSYQVGDRVLGLGKGFMRRFAKVNAKAASRIPDNVDLAEAATVPIAFLTAEYCLLELGRIKSGDSVLIHLGTGGVGLAAIQIAKSVGATIFATAGSEEKRQYLRDLGIEHVMNSRSLDFAEEVRAATDGHGVDLVLNALSGAAIEKGLECLAPFGRFVEIGKRDLAADHPIGLRSLYHNNSYAVFDLGEMMDEAAHLIEKPFRSVLEKLADGTYTPLPTTLFPASKAADAMRHLAKAVHIGKVVVAFDEANVAAEHDLGKPIELRSDATYLVTGGLRGFGLTVAEWLAERGAGALVLASRSGAPDTADAARVEKIAAKADVRCVALDVTDRSAVDALIRSLAGGERPIAGIVHSAAVIDDALLDQLTPERIAGVVDPKLGGAWNLHQATEDAGIVLDHFVTFSSVAAAVGSLGQTNYVAANAGLERLSEYRRSRGLRALAIGWGSLAESGFVARSDAMKSYLASAGIRPLTDAEAFVGLDQLMRVDNPAMVYAAVDWAALGRAMPGGNAPRLAALASDGTRGGNRLAVRLASAPESEHETIVAEAIREEVAKVLRIEPTSISFDRKLTELGLDSLSSFELKNHIEALCDLTIPVAKFLQAPTVGGLATIVTGLLANERAKLADAVDVGDGTSGPTPADELPTLERQALALSRSAQRHASNWARGPHSFTHSVPVPDSLDVAVLERAVISLAEREDALQLVGERSPEGWRVRLGPMPKLQRIGEGGDRQVLPDANGSLWAFVLRETDGHRELIAYAHPAGGDQSSVERAAEAVLAIANGAHDAPTASSWSAHARDLAAPEGSDAYRRDYSYWREMIGRAPSPLLPAERTRAIVPSRVGAPRGLLREKTEALGVPGLEALDDGAIEIAAITALARAIGFDIGSDSVVIERHRPPLQDGSMPLGPNADALPIVLTDVLGPAERLAARTRDAVHGAETHRAFDRAMIDHVFERLLTRQPIALGEFGFSLNRAPSADEGVKPPYSENALRVNILADGAHHLLQLIFDAESIGEEQVDRLIGSFREELAAVLRTDMAVLAARPLAEAVTARSQHQEKTVDPTTPQIITGRGGSLPVSMQQRDLLESLADPRATDEFRRFWVVSRSYWVRPGVDLNQLEAIVGSLQKRHEALRGRFVVEKGDLRVRIDDNIGNQLSIEDLGDIGRDAALKRAREITETPLDPMTDPLYAVHLLRCGKDGDLLVCLAHHSILDGWSMSVLVEELMAQFFGLPSPPVELSMAEYLREFDRSHDKGELQRRESYFRRLLADPPPIPNLGRIAKGVAPNLDMVAAGPGAELVVPLGDRGRAAVADRVAQTGATETALLVAAYAETIARKGGVDDVIMLLPAAMRTDRRLRYFVGWVATLMPVRAKVRDHDSTASLARSIAAQIRTSTDFLPADFALLDSIRDELTDAGSYLALFNAGMQTVDSLYRGSATAAFHRPGGGEQIDFGPIQIEKVGDETVRSESVWELDLRSFDAADGKAIRLGYDTLGFNRDEAEGILSEVLGRLGVEEDEAALSDAPAE